MAKKKGQLTILHRQRDAIPQRTLPLLHTRMHPIQQILEILALQVPQRLHRRALHLLHIALHGAHLVVHRHHTAHGLIEPLVVIRRHLLDEVVQPVDLVVDDLHAVVQVGELVLLGLYVCREDVLDHLGDVGVDGLVLLVRALEPVAVDAGRGLDFLGLGLLGDLLLLVLGLALVGPGSGLLAGVGVGGGDEELVDFEGIGVFGGGGGDAEVVAVGELDLGDVRVHRGENIRGSLPCP